MKSNDTKKRDERNETIEILNKAFDDDHGLEVSLPAEAHSFDCGMA